ncbi:MAG: hypothetical protein ACP5VS_10170 [Desulfomonilaceae bacterium]
MANDLKTSSGSAVEAEDQKNNKDLDKALFDYRPIPEWLTAVLNWLPNETQGSLSVKLDDESLNKEIEQSFTSPKKQQFSGTGSGIKSLKNIPPLYTSPTIEGEGVWASKDTPTGPDGVPLIYKTAYRPSVEFPNSIVYMALFDMSRLKARLFIGQTEPGIYQISDTTPRESLSRIVAITNAMWMQQLPGAPVRYLGAMLSILWSLEWPR